MNKKPRLLLVQPTTVHLDGTPHKTRWRLIMGLMIPLMAGLTPDDFDVTLCDERLEDIDFDGGWDLVGMTTTIGASLRAYQLADEFRKKRRSGRNGRLSRHLADRRSVEACRRGGAGRGRPGVGQLLQRLAATAR